MDATIKSAIREMLDIYGNLSIYNLVRLIFRTSEIGGCSFVSIKGYNSDKSGNTEVADHIINVGATYTNMKSKDAIRFEDVNLDEIDVTKFNYDTIDLNGVALSEYQEQVRLALPQAKFELCNPSKKETNDVWLNKVLVYNTNTKKLSVFGQSIGQKKVVVEGDYKVVKSAPKTIAKKLIQNFVSSRKATIRRFTIDNTLQSITLKGDTIEIG
jgi:hypothetical protein